MTLPRKIFSACLLFSALLPSVVYSKPAKSQVRVPAHASLDASGRRWTSHRGFSKRGERCVEIKIPANAALDPTGRGWICQERYERRGLSCVHYSKLTDGEVRAVIVRQSRRGYKGDCPCPHNRDASGRRCGPQSAYSRAGGRSVKCYHKDVTDAEIVRFRQVAQPASVPKTKVTK